MEIDVKLLLIGAVAGAMLAYWMSAKMGVPGK